MAQRKVKSLSAITVFLARTRFLCLFLRLYYKLGYKANVFVHFTKNMLQSRDYRKSFIRKKYGTIALFTATGNGIFLLDLLRIE